VQLTETKLFDVEQDGEGYWPTLSLRLRAENTHRIYIYFLWHLKCSQRYSELRSYAMRVGVKVSADSAASLLYTEHEGAGSSVNSVTTMPQASTTQNTSYFHMVTYTPNSPMQLRQQHYFSSTFYDM
jgi:hypothetical protein